MNTTKAHKKINIGKVVKIIVDKYGPVEKIVLFGSQARGEADEYSDLDLIIIKKTHERFIKRLIEAPSLPVQADIFVYTPEEFERMKEDQNPFIENALRCSKIIYEKP